MAGQPAQESSDDVRVVDLQRPRPGMGGQERHEVERSDVPLDRPTERQEQSFGEGHDPEVRPAPVAVQMLSPPESRQFPGERLQVGEKLVPLGRHWVVREPRRPAHRAWIRQRDWFVAAPAPTPPVDPTNPRTRPSTAFTLGLLGAGRQWPITPVRTGGRGRRVVQRARERPRQRGKTGGLGLGTAEIAGEVR